MKRTALIIGNTGADLPGVAVDMDNYDKFLRSPLGGLWSASEIHLLDNPKETTLKHEISSLQAADYSLVVFCGHGEYKTSIETTLVQIRPKVWISEDDLKIGAQKHILILDCCRWIESEVAVESMITKADSMAPSLNESDCRIYFDKKIKECPPGLVVMYACSRGETAGETGLGGRYSVALINGARQWHQGSDVDTSKIFSTLSVTKAHSMAEETVKRRSGQRQNPLCEYPRTAKHFPFAIVA